MTTRVAIRSARSSCGDDEQRRAGALGMLAEEVVHLVGAHGIELTGRLVGDDKPGPVRERGGQSDALPLTAGERARPSGREMVETQSSQRAGCVAPSVVTTRAGQVAPEGRHCRGSRGRRSDRGPTAG